MAKITSTNPAKNFAKIGSVNISTKKEIEEKVKKARMAQPEWQNIGVSQRVKLLREVYNALYSKRKEISELACKEMGFPITEQETFDMGDGFNFFDWYLNNAEKYLTPEITFESETEIHKAYLEPLGVVAVIQPWNFPFCQWSWGVVPNLVVGNTVVFKHSEEVPLTGKLIEDIILSCNLPEGVFNEVYGNVGEILTDQEIDMIAFTGSCRVGKIIYEKAAKKFIKVLLELGGSAPGIVFDDVDIDSTAEAVFGVRFTNNGQACDGLKRLVVHESVFDKMVQKLKIIAESKKIGDPLNKDTEFGPLVNQKQLDLIISQVKDATSKGSKVITGGKELKNLSGAYFEPTILTNIKPNMRVWKEEVFGPVLPIVSFKTEEEAIKLANDTDYGLGSYVFSKDLKRAERVSKQIKAGDVSVNGTNYVCPFNSFGGYKASGMGREHGRSGFYDLCQVKVIAINK